MRLLERMKDWEIRGVHEGARHAAPLQQCWASPDDHNVSRRQDRIRLAARTIGG